VRRATERQAHDAFLGVTADIARVQALGQVVKSTQTALAAIEAGFEVGTRTSVDVVNAQRNLYQSRRDHQAARYAYVLDGLRLKQAAGTLSDEDIAAIDRWLQ
jgi:outer membrane protein